MNPAWVVAPAAGTVTRKLHPSQRTRYVGRISSPLLDRFDLVVEVPRLTLEELARAPEGESTATVRERVLAARERMKARQEKLNSELFGRALRQHTALPPSCKRPLNSPLASLERTAPGGTQSGRVQA